MIIEKDIIINSSKIHYRIAGDTQKETLVFLHGWPGTKYLKSSLIEELSKDFYVISPELPGLLRSEPLISYTNIFEQYADTIFQILSNEKMDNSVHIIMGQSFGGIVASTFAEKYKLNTKMLILTDAQMGVEKLDFLRKILFRYGRLIIDTYIRMPNIIKKQGLRSFFGIISTKDSKENNKLLKDRVSMVDNCCKSFQKSIKEKNNLLNRKYSNIPIVMLWGNRDGKEFNISGHCPVEDAEKLYNQMKSEGQNVKLSIVDGGHTILYENSKEVISEIKRTIKGYN